MRRAGSRCRRAPRRAAADALGVQVGQIAKSVIFRRKADEVAVLVVTSGDKRVDEKKVAAQVGSLGRADADFVKARTGFTIGGVSPLAHATPAVTLIDRELFRFDEIWAAAGHPNGVFRLSPAQLEALTGAPGGRRDAGMSAATVPSPASACARWTPAAAGAKAACARSTRSPPGR